MSNTTLVKTHRVGDSLVVSLLKEIVEANKIREGETLEITVRKICVDGFGALRGIDSLIIDDELKSQK